MNTPLRCLIIEDSPDDSALLVRELRRGGYDVTSERVDTPEAMSAALARQPWDIVIADYKMPRFSGLAALELLKASGLDLPFIIVSGTIGEDTAVEAMRQGAHDYLMKGKLARLVPAMQRELRDAVERRERKRAESALGLQSAALTAAANAIVLTDRDGTIVWVNPAFASLTGYTPAEAVGKNPRDLVKSGQHERAVYQDLWETILAGRVWHGELVNRRKDGSLYPEEQTITPVHDAKGEITHFIAIKQDLTERRAAEQVVRAARERFQAVFEQAAVGMVIAEGAGGRIINVNRRFCEMVGRTAAELIHLTSGDITHPDDIPEDRKQMDLINRGVARSFSREKRYLKKDGSHLWVSAFVAPLDPSDANSGLRIGVFADITDRKQAEAAIRQSEAKYRALFDTLIEGFCTIEMIFDGDGKPVDYRFMEINPAFEKQTGLKNAQGRLMRDLVPNNEERWFEIYGKIALTGEPARFENETKALGRHFDVCAYRIGGSESRKVAILFNDVTTRHQAEMALRASERKFQSVFEQAAVGVTIAEGPRGRFVNVNLKFCEMVGYTAAELLQLSSHDITHPDDLAEDADQLNQISFGVIREFSREKRYRRKDGSYVWAKVYVAPLDPTEAKPNLRIGVIADISERKQAEEALQTSEARHRMFLERVTFPVCHVNKQGVIDFRNRRFIETLGYVPEEVPTLAEWWLRAFPDPTYRQWVTSTWDQVVQHATESAQDLKAIEYGVTCKSGEVRMVEISGVVISDGVLVTFFDVTARKQAEAAVLQNAEDLRVRNAMLERFNGVAVGRELRMIELKHEVNELCGKLGEPPRHQVAKSEPAPPAEQETPA